jgi:tetraacyldisaccharide 4'-kinase
MRAPRFWWARRPGIAALALWPVSRLYASIAASRMRGQGEKPPLPLVCVGNFVAGGAGKTPVAIALAGLARDIGLKPVFLTRGHGGRLGGPVLVDPASHTARQVGDEALLLAAVAPTVKSVDRRAAFGLLASLGADLCIMDDGFQNPGVAKTFSFVVVDGAVGIGNGLTLPSGPLRAPLALQLDRADAVIVMGAGEAGDVFAARVFRTRKPLLRASLRPARTRLPGDGPLFAYAGIGRPQKFFSQLEADGYKLGGRRSFPDHHAFTETDAAWLLAATGLADARPVTTAKDAARLAGCGGRRGELLGKSLVYRIEAEFVAPDTIRTLLRSIRERWLIDTYC